MNSINLEEYKQIIKNERERYFVKPAEMVQENFTKIGYDQFDCDFFRNNASEVMETLRKECWNSFQKEERGFTTKMLCSLLDYGLLDSATINKLNGMEAISYFVEQSPESIYTLALSNTQSRRSRAGKEFEAIIERIFVGAGIPIESQGSIGKKKFESKGIAKMVDFVSPGVNEYSINKRDTILISAKTTLRERWQEVSEEVNRTGAREMYLITLDQNVSQDVINALNEDNIYLTTTKRIKQECYNDDIRILSLEELIKKMLHIATLWNK